MKRTYPLVALIALTLAAMTILPPVRAEDTPSKPMESCDDAAASQPEEECRPGGIVGALDCIKKKIPAGPAPGAAAGKAGSCILDAARKVTGSTEPCTKMTLSYAPSQIRYLRGGADPTLTFEPPNCQNPKEWAPARFRIVKSSGVQFMFSNTSLTDGWLFIAENKPGEATIEATFGTLAPARATVTAVESEKCTLMWMTLRTPIHVGDFATANVQLTPDDCPQDRSGVEYSSAASEIAWIKPGSNILYGRATGETTITATKDGMSTEKKITITNDGENCQQLFLSYPLRDGLRKDGKTKIREHTGYSPILDYGPHNCRRPDGKPKFMENDRTIIRVDPDTGVVTGVSAGRATVVVEHGAMLPATTEITVVPTPGCDSVRLSYNSPLLVGRDALPATEFTQGSHHADDDNDRTNCLQVGGLDFSTSDSSVVLVAPDGRITALQPGKAVITLKVGTLPPAQAEVVVVRQ